MEHLGLHINDSKRFHEVIKNSLPEAGDMEIITLDDGTIGGRAAVMVTFTVKVNGTMQRAQSVTSMRMFRAIAFAIASTYNDEGFRVNMDDPLDDGIIGG